MSMQSMAVGRVPAWSLRNRLPVILRDWRLWLLVGSVALAAGLAWQWRWLAAIGVVPFLLSAAPCAAMCAFRSVRQQARRQFLQERFHSRRFPDIGSATCRAGRYVGPHNS